MGLFLQLISCNVVLVEEVEEMGEWEGRKVVEIIWRLFVDQKSILNTMHFSDFSWPVYCAFWTQTERVLVSKHMLRAPFRISKINKNNKK